MNTKSIAITIFMILELTFLLFKSDNLIELLVVNILFILLVIVLLLVDKKFGFVEPKNKRIIFDEIRSY
jgi:L-asparagine transporter-like permease